MKTIVKAMTDEYLDTVSKSANDGKSNNDDWLFFHMLQIRQDLFHLWDECLLTQAERDEFMATLYHKGMYTFMPDVFINETNYVFVANTMDTVHLIVDNHIAYLKNILSSSQTVSGIMKDRKDLIQVK